MGVASMTVANASAAGCMYGVWKAPETGTILPDLPAPNALTSSHSFSSTARSPEHVRPSGNI